MHGDGLSTPHIAAKYQVISTSYSVACLISPSVLISVIWFLNSRRKFSSPVARAKEAVKDRHLLRHSRLACTPSCARVVGTPLTQSGAAAPCGPASQSQSGRVAGQLRWKPNYSMPLCRYFDIKQTPSANSQQGLPVLQTHGSTQC